MNRLKPENRPPVRGKLRSYFLSAMILLLLGATSATAQNARISADFRNRTIEQVIGNLKSSTDYEFVYSADILRGNSARITRNFNNASLTQVLDAVLVPNGLEYEIVGKVVSIRRARPQTASQDVVTGTVTDQRGNSLVGASIVIEQNNTGTTTDAEGRFQLRKPQGLNTFTIIISYIGYETARIPYTGQQTMTVRLKEQATTLDDIVVTGYSSRKASELTGSVQTMKGDNVVKNSTAGGIFSSLTGETTGLQISGTSPVPGHEGELLLRGMGTLFNTNSSSGGAAEAMPLIVIDGNITEYTSLSGIVAPNDIADITILKDASSTAIYGSRAATGVIVITTKQGTRGGLRVNFNADLGVSRANFGGTKMMNSQELYEYGMMIEGNNWDVNEYLQEDFPTREAYLDYTFKELRDNFDLTRTTDWRDIAYRTALTQDYSVNISGGADKVQYYVSYNYRSEEGILEGYDLQRNIFRGRCNFNITDFLSVNANVNASFVNSKAPNYNTGEAYLPWFSPYDNDGKIVSEIANWGESFYSMLPDNPLTNPLVESRYNNTKAKQSDLFGSFGAVVTPFSWLSFSTTNTFTLNNYNSNDYYDMRTLGGNGPNNNYSNGKIAIGDTRETSFLTSNILRAQHSWGDHSLSGLVGQEWYERHSRSSNIRMYDQTVAGERNAGGFSQGGVKGSSSVLAAGGGEYEKASFSIFSEVNYNYRSKYMLSASVRADKSTNFGKNNRTGTFYSFGGAWLVTRENFMQGQNVFDVLKLRFSYGTSGKEAGIDYLNYTLYKTDLSGFNYYSNHPRHQSQYPAVISQLGNPDLSWEVAYNTNVGFDVSVLSNRVSLSADYYHRRNSKLIMQVGIPSAQGLGRQYRNIGEMVNKGIELTLNTHNVRTQDFNWYSNVTFTYNHNELTKLDNGTYSPYPETEFYVGESIDEIKTIIIDHIDPTTGLAMYERILEDGTIEYVNSYFDIFDDDNLMRSIGVGRAPYWGGFNNTFRYKNLELNVRTSFAFGHYALNKYVTDMYSTPGTQMWRDYGINMMKLPGGLKMWEKPGDVADLPQRNADMMTDYTQMIEGTNLQYSKADNFKLEQIRLTYYIPEKFTRKARLSNAYVSFTCDNVHIFTRKEFKGLDPDAYIGYGAPRRFTFSLNLTF